MPTRREAEAALCAMTGVLNAPAGTLSDEERRRRAAVIGVPGALVPLAMFDVTAEQIDELVAWWPSPAGKAAA